MEINTLKGFTYVATAKTDATITDDNGLNLLVKAGGQGTFIATADKVAVTGSATITQTRNFKGALALNAGGGKGEVIQPGEVIIGGTQGSITIADLNTMIASPIFLNGSELPEGVTLENLTNGLIGGNINTNYISMTFGTTRNSPFPYGAICAKYKGRRLPSSINLAKLNTAFYMFAYSELEEVKLSLPALYNQQQGMFSGSLNLVSAEVETPIMTNGAQMFINCSSLSHFRGDLSSLTGASGMFSGCKLDLESVQHIASSINNATSVSGSHPITIGVDSTKVAQSQQDSANAILVGKGWTVTWQRN